MFFTAGKNPTKGVNNAFIAYCRNNRSYNWIVYSVHQQGKAGISGQPDRGNNRNNSGDCNYSREFYIGFVYHDSGGAPGGGYPFWSRYRDRKSTRLNSSQGY